MNEHLNERRLRSHCFAAHHFDTVCTVDSIWNLIQMPKRNVELMRRSRASMSSWSINSQHILPFGVCVRCARMHSSLMLDVALMESEYWIIHPFHDDHLNIANITTSTGYSGHSYSSGIPQSLDVDAHTHTLRSMLFELMRMKTTKTPSLIEYSAIPTNARRKTTTKFIYSIFFFFLFDSLEHVYVIMSPSILAYDGKTEIVHAFDRPFNVGFLCTRNHTFTQACHERKKNY